MGSPGRFAMRMLTATKDIIMLRVLPRRLTDDDVRKARIEVANDRELDQALKETLTARPQFRRNGSGGGDIQGRAKP